MPSRTAGAAYELLIRLGRLMDQHSRAGAGQLLPVQATALIFLARANRYSDSPAAVADYLCTTKGTASQTLRVLEDKKLIRRQNDPDDGRRVHLQLTAKGKRQVQTLVETSAIVEAIEPRAYILEAELRGLLTRLQQDNGHRLFGVCRGCRHLRGSSKSGWTCGLTNEPLLEAETDKLCREHKPASS